MQTEVLELKKQAALKAYKEGDARDKALLERLYGKETFVFDWRNITTLQQVCDIAGEDISDFEVPAIIKGDDKRRRLRGKILYSTMELICDVFKVGVVLDYDNRSQSKHYLWGERKAGSGFALDAVTYDNSATSVGARLSVDEDAKCRHIWKHFGNIWSAWWEGQ